MEDVMTRFDGPMNSGIPPMDPNAYAQKFATENGISLNEAKSQLRAKFGDPQKPNSTFAPQVRAEVSTQQLRNTPLLSFSDESVATYKMPERGFTYNPAELKEASPAQLASFVKYGIETTGLSEKEFAEMIGLPDKEQPDDNMAKQKLKELGIPDDVIQKGDRAIRKYAQQNGIELTPKERK